MPCASSFWFLVAFHWSVFFARELNYCPDGACVCMDSAPCALASRLCERQSSCAPRPLRVFYAASGYACLVLLWVHYMPCWACHACRLWRARRRARTPVGGTPACAHASGRHAPAAPVRCEIARLTSCLTLSPRGQKGVDYRQLLYLCGAY